MNPSMMKYIFPAFLLLITSSYGILSAQPRYSEHLFWTPNTVKHTSEFGSEVTSNMPRLSYSRAVVGRDLYAVFDMTATVQAMIDLTLYLMDADKRDDIDSIDMPLMLWGTGKKSDFDLKLCNGCRRNGRCFTGECAG
jgi:hypothetical protein